MRNWAEDQITLIMIRHGAAKSNREGRYLGKTDEPLSEEGVKELLRYKELQYYPRVDRLFVSPMERCVQTAEILYPDRKPIYIEEWREIDFGAFEGKNYLELCTDERYQRWVCSGGRLPFPEGESREEFILRCGQGFEKMIKHIENAEKLPESIGIVAHGGTIMALLRRYCGGAYFDYQAANGKGYVCTYSGGKCRPKLTIEKKI